MSGSHDSDAPEEVPAQQDGHPKRLPGHHLNTLIYYDQCTTIIQTLI